MASSTLWVNTVLVMAVGSFCSHHLAANAVIERDFTTESPCRGDSVFHCDDVNVECVPINQTCNGVSECSSGRDESVEVCGCLPNEFQCNKTTCIDMIKRCDTFADCDDGEDEKRCETYFCPETHEKCSNNLCIPKSSRCNFVDDCGDNSDEVKCSHRKCHSTEFRCNNSQCVPNSLLCDERDDCLDGSDEVDCSSHVKCINSLYVHKDRVCDGWIDCFDDHADEINCGNCTGNQFRCNNGRCIKDANKCDGVCDCVGDCGDEASCNSLSCPLGSFYLCRRSHRCISRKYVCDGHNDCQNSQDGADEYFCWNKTDKCRGFSNSKHAHFVCPEGRCIPATSRCDYYADCLWGEDEFNCTYPPCSADEFRCDNGQCVAWTRRCNGGSSPDCYDRSDEVGCENHSCPFGHRKCLGGQCLPEGKWCDFWRDCPDNSDEMDCIRPSCTADEFLCNNGQCVSKHMECYKGLNTERLGCADGSHLFYCREWKCKPGQFKCRNSYCIDDSQVCNDNLDCSMTYTDELSCEFKCPASTRECVCKEVKMNCGDRNLTTVPNPEDSIQLDMSGNYINYSISEKTFQNYDMLTELDISRNSLTFLPRGCFRNLWRLSTLNLAFNNLTQIRNETFTGLTSLRSMFLHGNRIKTVDPYAFKGLSDLLTLDLSGQQINHIAQDAFNGLRNVRVLNLSRNNIEGIDDGAFNGLHQLLTLDISHNRLRTIGKNAFHGLPQLQTLYTDEFRFCCLVKEVSDCYPKPDEFSSCEDLMSNYVLRINIWILGMVASFGNLLVIGWRARDLKSGKVHSFLITNLALGDFFMGVYLLIIAVADSYYRGVYSIHDKFWRESVLCKFAGFMSTFSSELSVFTLTVITLDRLICIIFPFRMRRMGLREARLVMLCLWLAVSVMASLPLVGIHYFDTFYSRSGVCLAFHITPDRPRGWEYSVALFMAVNFFSFFIIFASYLWMFIVAKRTRCAVRDAEAKTDNAMAKRMTMIVLTDFACWVPIILLGCASLGGARIPPEVYAWVAVFILPVNSAINPVLYTISTAPFLGHVRKRATKFRKSFMSSMSVDTKHSFMGGVAGDDNAECQVLPYRLATLYLRGELACRAASRSDATEDGTSNYWERTKSHYRQLELIRMRPLTKSSASQTVARNGCQPTREDKYGDTQCMMADLFKNDDLDSGQSHAEINSTEEFV